MQAYQKAFIEFALERQVLKFGQFTLKSGRVSPYFFNAGGFTLGSDLSKLGSFYAAAIQDQAPDFDLMLGPAYKGIPLVSATCVALFNEHQRDVPWVFNRKEKKDHGEGGTLVGSELKGRVMIIDDVITAGTAIREVEDLIASYEEASIAGVIVAVDRQEKGQGEKSAVQEVEERIGVPVISIVNLNQIISFLEQSPEYAEYMPAVKAYQSEWAVS